MSAWKKYAHRSNPRGIVTYFQPKRLRRLPVGGLAPVWADAGLLPSGDELTRVHGELNQVCWLGMSLVDRAEHTANLSLAAIELEALAIADGGLP